MKLLIIIILNILIHFFKTATSDLLDNSTSVADLECNFYVFSYNTYSCEQVNKFDVKTEVTSITGTHKYGKTFSDINGFMIRKNSETKYVPMKLCSLIKNLRSIFIQGMEIVELKKELFTECTKLTTVGIEYSKLKELDEDLLSTIPNLEKLTISDTKIEILPKNFFKNNQKLHTLTLQSNSFKIIQTDFPSSIRLFSMSSNLCANGFYFGPGQMNLETFVGKIHEKCNSNFSAPATGFFTHHEMKMKILESQVDDNKNKLIDLEEEFENTSTELKELVYGLIFGLDVKDIRNDIFSTKSTIEDTEKSMNQQMKTAQKIRNQLLRENADLDKKLDEANRKFQEISDELMEKISQTYFVAVGLIIFQLLIGCVVGLLIFYKQF